MTSERPANNDEPDGVEHAASIPMDSVPIVAAEELLRGGRELLIRNGDDVYRLIRTRNGKLLLNKQ